jgi:hypothetical protein
MFGDMWRPRVACWADDVGQAPAAAISGVRSIALREGGEAVE